MSWRMQLEEGKKLQEQEMKQKEHALEDALVSMDISKLNKAFDEVDRYMYYLHFKREDARASLYGDFLERFQAKNGFELLDEESGYGHKHRNRSIRVMDGQKRLGILDLPKGEMKLYQQRKYTSLGTLEDRRDTEKRALARHEKNILHLELDLKTAENQDEADKVQARLGQVNRLKVSCERHIARLEEDLANRETLKKELKEQEKMMIELAKKHGFSIVIKE